MSEESQSLADKSILDDESRTHIELIEAVGPLDLTLPVHVIRNAIEMASTRFRGEYNFVGAKTDLSIPGADGKDSIPCTVLKPDCQRASWSHVMVYFHGGGWVWGSRNTHIAFCERVCQ